MVIHGDLFDVLPTLEADSFDACVTDGPYGLGFMGKKWDTFAPGVAEKRIVPNRAIDSENPNLKGRTRGPASSPSAIEYDRTLAGQRKFQEWTERWGREVYRVLKPGAYIVSCGAPRSHHRMMSGLEDAGFVVRDCFAWLFGSGFPKNKNIGDGRGTALKPAHEPIALAWKPFNSTITANVEQWGTGALNIDACRIAGAKRDPGFVAPASKGIWGGAEQQKNWPGADFGRWPANVLLDEDAAMVLDEQTGQLSSGGGDRGSNGHGLRGNTYIRQSVDVSASIGGASRFYYVAKPSREERDYGCEGLRARTGGECTDREEGTAGLNNPRAGAGRTGGGRNSHPTVKPVELMRWLVKLVTPLHGKVLDPFGGSFTTAMACAYEHRGFTIIEREAEYVDIGVRRLRSVAPLFGDSDELIVRQVASGAAQSLDDVQADLALVEESEC